MLGKITAKSEKHHRIISTVSQSTIRETSHKHLNSVTVNTQSVVCENMHNPVTSDVAHVPCQWRVVSQPAGRSIARAAAAQKPSRDASTCHIWQCGNAAVINQLHRVIRVAMHNSDQWYHNLFRVKTSCMIPLLLHILLPQSQPQAPWLHCKTASSVSLPLTCVGASASEDTTPSTVHHTYDQLPWCALSTPTAGNLRGQLC